MQGRRRLCSRGRCGKIKEEPFIQRSFYADDHLTGHGGHHAAAGPRPQYGLCSLRRPRPAVRLRRGHPGGGPPCRGQPDACGRRLSDPLSRRPHLRPAGSAADAGGPGPHPAAAADGSERACRHLERRACPHRAAALCRAPAGSRRAAGTGCAVGGLAGGCCAASLCHPAPGAQRGLSVGAAPGRPVRPGPGPGAGGAGAAMETSAAGAERSRERPHRGPGGGAGRAAPGAEHGILRRHGPLRRAGAGRTGR